MHENAQPDADLEAVIDAWPDLEDEMKRRIIAILDEREFRHESLMPLHGTRR